MDRAGFDPRYNPEFQRGFDPAVHSGPETSQDTHERIPSIDQPPRIPPVPVPVPGGSAREDVAATAGTEAEEIAADESDDVVSPWKNPYIIVLTVLGVAMLAIGIGGFRWSVEQVYAGQFGFAGEEDAARDGWLAAQVAWGLTPLLALAGVLTLVGVGFFIAMTWRPYRRAGDDEYGDFDDIDQTH